MFLDTQNLSKWQPDLISFESLGDQESRSVGAKTKQVHKMGKRQLEIIETITANNHPEEFSATYEAEGVWNLVENRFIEADEHKTKWVLDSEFKCTGIARLMAFFMPGMFKKQTLSYMNLFKNFAENSSG